MKINDMKTSDLSASGGLVQNSDNGEKSYNYKKE